jgi:hypothetical protein
MVMLEFSLKIAAVEEPQVGRHNSTPFADERGDVDAQKHKKSAPADQP